MRLCRPCGGLFRAILYRGEKPWHRKHRELFDVVLFRVHSDDSVLHVARLKRDIHLRGVADKGVMAHFFIPGY